MSEFNLPLLRKAVEWAESEARKPRSLSEWCQSFFAVEGTNINRECGTAYCIAGWVMHEHAEGEHHLQAYSIDGEGDAEEAQDLLGISAFDAWGDFSNEGLFSASNSIEDVRRQAEQIARRYGEEL